MMEESTHHRMSNTMPKTTSLSRQTPLAALLVSLVLGGAETAIAQRQSSEDCKLPGGCGTSDKPGGVERAPDMAAPPMLRSMQPPRPIAPSAPAAAPAPVMAPPPPPVAAPPAAVPAPPAATPATPPAAK